MDWACPSDGPEPHPKSSYKLTWEKEARKAKDNLEEDYTEAKLKALH